MPLSPAAARDPIHQRDIVLRGYRRADGLFDIEATLRDTKNIAFENDERGVVTPGTPIHDMAMRLTVDLQMQIVGCEAAMDSTPYGICPQVTPNFERLVGLKIGRGFLRAASERVGGPQGCVHLRELLQQLATVAFQTIAPFTLRDSASLGAVLIDTCYAHAATSSVTKRRWPDLARDPDPR